MTFLSFHPLRRPGRGEGGGAVQAGLLPAEHPTKSLPVWGEGDNPKGWEGPDS